MLHAWSRSNQARGFCNHNNTATLSTFAPPRNIPPTRYAFTDAWFTQTTQLISQLQLQPIIMPSIISAKWRRRTASCYELCIKHLCMENKIKCISIFGHPIPPSYIGFQKDLSKYFFSHGKQAGIYEYFTSIFRPGVLKRGPSAACVLRPHFRN